MASSPHYLHTDSPPQNGDKRRYQMAGNLKPDQFQGSFPLLYGRDYGCFQLGESDDGSCYKPRNQLSEETCVDLSSDSEGACFEDLERQRLRNSDTRKNSFSKSNSVDCSKDYNIASNACSDKKSAVNAKRKIRMDISSFQTNNNFDSLTLHSNSTSLAAFDLDNREVRRVLSIPEIVGRRGFIQETGNLHSTLANNEGMRYTDSRSYCCKRSCFEGDKRSENNKCNSQIHFSNSDEMCTGSNKDYIAKTTCNCFNSNKYNIKTETAATSADIGFAFSKSFLGFSNTKMQNDCSATSSESELCCFTRRAVNSKINDNNSNNSATIRSSTRDTRSVYNSVNSDDNNSDIYNSINSNNRSINNASNSNNSSNSTSDNTSSADSGNNRGINFPLADEKSTKFRVKESDRDNLSLTKSGVTLTLLNSSLWRAFNRVGTEMIINRGGRRMFPYLSLSVQGLSPLIHYAVSVQITPASKRRCKFINSKWVPVGLADTESTKLPYFHMDSPSLGRHWNRTKINFSKIKLTNNKESAPQNVLLHSMHKYSITTTFTRVDIGVPSEKSPSVDSEPKSLTFEFPETDFIAVTAYQNESVTQMKIHNNPFAKAFRDASFTEIRKRIALRKRKHPSGRVRPDPARLDNSTNLQLTPYNGDFVYRLVAPLSVSSALEASSFAWRPFETAGCILPKCHSVSSLYVPWGHALPSAYPGGSVYHPMGTQSTTTTTSTTTSTPAAAPASDDSEDDVGDKANVDSPTTQTSSGHELPSKSNRFYYTARNAHSLMNEKSDEEEDVCKRD